MNSTDRIRPIMYQIDDRTGLVNGEVKMPKFFRRFMKKVHPEEDIPLKKKSIIDPPKEEDLITDFMVKDQKVKKNKEENEIEPPENIYQPGVDAETIVDHDQTGSNSEHLMGHEVEVVDLPVPEEEVVDTSWIDLDIHRDFKNIMKELESKNVNCYHILDVPRNSEVAVIRKAYRTLASKYHPDRGSAIKGMTEDQIREKIREINYSKEILLDPTMRALHDQTIRDSLDHDTFKVDDSKRKFDPSLLELFPEKTQISADTDKMVSYFSEEEDGTRGLGVLIFKKWHEDQEHFSDEFIDYMIELDENGYVDYGEVLIGDLSDMDEIFKLKKVSNYSQAVNNKLLEVWVLPPFYYLAVPIKNRDHVQDICDMLKENFEVESVFFDYPRM